MSHQLVCSARSFCEKKVCARSKKDFGQLQSVYQINRPQMRVLEEHPGVFMIRDNRDLRDVQPKLKEARDGLMTKVVETKVR